VEYFLQIIFLEFTAWILWAEFAHTLDSGTKTNRRNQVQKQSIMADRNRNQKTSSAPRVFASAAGVPKGEQTPPLPGIAPRLAMEIERAKAMAEKLKMPFVDPLSSRIEPTAIDLVNQDTAKKLQVLPIRVVENTMLVAMASPDKGAIKTLELLTACKIRPAVAPQTALAIVSERAYKKRRRPSADFSPNTHAGPSKAIATNEEPATRAQTIAIISNKGGVGKTHFAINLAYALTQKGAKVLLIDADLGNADVSNKLGIFPEHHLLDFLEKHRGLEDLIVETPYRFDLICGTYGEFKLANLNHGQKTRFINHFKKTSLGYDYAIFDLGAGIARTVLDFALGADRTIIVTTPQDLISGYACAKAAFSRFKELEERLENKLSDYRPQWAFSPMVVINQVNHMEQGFKLFESLVKTTNENINPNEDRFRIALQYLGSIQYDKESLRDAESKKRPVLLHSPYIKASQCIEHMAAMIRSPDKDVDPRVKFGHSFKRFMAILSKGL
jgi:flagellar biosynthesis protein FlhG